MHGNEFLLRFVRTEIFGISIARKAHSRIALATPISRRLLSKRGVRFEEGLHSKFVSGHSLQSHAEISVTFPPKSPFNSPGITPDSIKTKQSPLEQRERPRSILEAPDQGVVKAWFVGPNSIDCSRQSRGEYLIATRSFRVSVIQRLEPCFSGRP